VLCSSEDHLRTGTHDLSQPFLTDAKNTNSWHARNGDLQCVFPLDILMVPSSALTIAADGECPSCNVFSPDKTIRFGSLGFIAVCFSGLRLSPKGCSSDVIAMGSTHGGPLPLLWAMTKVSTWLQLKMGGSTNRLPEGTTWGLRPPPAQPYHGQIV
jgi:hypothetical protein